MSNKIIFRAKYKGEERYLIDNGEVESAEKGYQGQMDYKHYGNIHNNPAALLNFLEFVKKSGAEEKSTRNKESIIMTDDCTYLYFKPSGKWKYDGRGRFPRNPNPNGGLYDVDRDAIIRENGSMPGLAQSYRADDLVVVVIPDEDCDCKMAYPRMLKPEVTSIYD